MKKLITGILITAFVLSLGTVCIYAFSQPPESSTGSAESSTVSADAGSTSATTESTTAAAASTTAKSTESTSAATTAAPAASTNTSVKTKQTTSSRCQYYIDQNNDGVCDHCASKKIRLLPAAASTIPIRTTTVSVITVHHSGNRQPHIIAAAEDTIISPMEHVIKQRMKG